ncbi:MAG: hypothetical protein ACUVTQ_11405 [Desulfotomaculales bacterium]
MLEHVRTVVQIVATLGGAVGLACYFLRHAGGQALPPRLGLEAALSFSVSAAMTAICGARRLPASGSLRMRCLRGPP